MVEALRPDDVPVLAPGVQIVAVGGRLLASFGVEVKYLGDGDADEFGPLLALIDGRRTVAQICEALADTYEADDVSGALAELIGDAIYLASSSPDDEPWRDPLRGLDESITRTRLLVIGGGVLADAVGARLRDAGFSRLTRATVRDAPGAGDASARVLAGAGAPTVAADADRDRDDGDALDAAALARAVDAADVVVVCAEDEPLAGPLAVNAACLRGSTPAVFATVDRAAIVVGPTMVPWRTACFECARLTACKLLRQGEIEPGVLRLARAYAAPESPAFHSALANAAYDVAREVCSLLAPQPAPTHFSSATAYGANGGPAPQAIDVTTECTSCRGANRRDIHLGRPEARDTADPGWARRPAVASVAGTRSVDEVEAKAIATRALDALGVRLKWRDQKTGRAIARYPALAGTHYGQVTGTQAAVFAGPNAATRGAPAVVLRDAPRHGLGKGATAEQAWCSTVYEWFERNIFFPPDTEIVRASAREVAGLSIDMAFYLRNPLPHYDDNERPLFSMDEPIDWVWGHCLVEQRPILLPARVAFPYTGAWFRGSKFLLPQRGSSGVAGGCTLEDAVLQGLLEVIEHDAWFSSIMTGVDCPTLDLSSIEDPYARLLIGDLDAAGFDVLLRWISNDIGVPVIEANGVARESFTHHVNSGWGAHIDPVIAVRRALSEVVQILTFHAGSLRGRSVIDSPNSIYRSHNDVQRRLSRCGPTHRFDEIPRPAAIASTSLAHLDACVTRLRDAIPNANVCFYDLSRCFGPTRPPEPGIFVASVFASGTQDEVGRTTHFTDRLLDYRRVMGDRDAPRFSIADLFLGRKEL
jgi:thiazole/oxazole-forming peptide maturase SagD family component